LHARLIMDCLIISLSLGDTRSFDLRALTEPRNACRLELACGDICTMEGMMQRHYRHRVPRERGARCPKPRVNLTWRWVKAHERSCALNTRCDTAGEEKMTTKVVGHSTGRCQPEKRQRSCAVGELEGKQHRKVDRKRHSGGMGTGRPMDTEDVSVASKGCRRAGQVARAGLAAGSQGQHPCSHDL